MRAVKIKLCILPACFRIIWVNFKLAIFACLKDRDSQNRCFNSVFQTAVAVSCGQYLIHHAKIWRTGKLVQSRILFMQLSRLKIEREGQQNYFSGK